MNKNSLINISMNVLREKYYVDLPKIIYYINESYDFHSFLNMIRNDVQDKINNPNTHIKNAANALQNLLDYEGQTIHELSKDKYIKVESLYYLYLFLNDDLPDFIPTDLFIDLYFLFMQLYSKYIPKKDTNIKNQSRRWKSGLNPDILDAREVNKKRIIKLLIEKIEARKSKSNKYYFKEGLSYDEKYKLVETWWDDYKFQLQMAVRSPRELNLYLNKTLSQKTMTILNTAKEKGIPFFVTPYYLSLLHAEGDYYNDEAIRCYVIYSAHLVDNFGKIRAWEREDIVEEGKPNAAGWYIPGGHNIHRRYPDVAILIPDTIGRSCGGLCAVCQRMYDFQSKRLNFDHKKLKPTETWDDKLKKVMAYFEKDTQLRDVLITGGDALMSQNESLRKIFNAVLVMARKKIEANKNRKEGQKYAQLQRVRLGTRLPVYLPMRIDDELITILKDFKDKASKLGIKQFVIQTHYESPLEVTKESKRAVAMLNSAGWTVTNQLVFTVAASRKGHTAKLRKVLNRIGVICYYTFSVKGFKENYELYAPISRSIQESIEEKSAGKLTREQTNELLEIFRHAKDKRIALNDFLDKHKLPFVATDRNVLNLPGIGKSMTFKTIGITPSGKRIIKYDYDHTRKHSPVIEHIPDVHIVENKSIAAYLRQLEQMGEKVNEKAALWSYRFGNTESRFGLYEYPEFDYLSTDHVNNVAEESKAVKISRF